MLVGKYVAEPDEWYVMLQPWIYQVVHYFHSFTTDVISENAF